MKDVLTSMMVVQGGKAMIPKTYKQNHQERLKLKDKILPVNGYEWC